MSQKKSEYNCWQCGNAFEREDEEWFCPDCIDDIGDLEVSRPQFKGRGFYSTS